MQYVASVDLHLNRRPWAVFLGAVWLALGAASDPARAGEQPTRAEASAFVQSLADRALGVLGNNALRTGGRNVAFESLLQEGFELNTIGRFVIGRYWNMATDDQRLSYQALFQAFVLKKYSTLLGTYSGQRFAVTRAVEVGDRDVVVSTEISQAGQPALRADWRVRRYDDALKIIDIKVEGISMLASQREEFTSVIQRDGIDGLLDLLRRHSEISAEGDLPSAWARAF